MSTPQDMHREQPLVEREEALLREHLRSRMQQDGVHPWILTRALLRVMDAVIMKKEI